MIVDREMAANRIVKEARRGLLPFLRTFLCIISTNMYIDMLPGILLTAQSLSHFRDCAKILHCSPRQKSDRYGLA
jgi:hypothetical protein